MTHVLPVVIEDGIPWVRLPTGQLTNKGVLEAAAKEIELLRVERDYWEAQAKRCSVSSIQAERAERAERKR